MDLGLSGRIAVVTGSTAGIGLASACALAREGATVVVNGRTEARVAAAIETIRRDVKAGEIKGVAADLGTEAGVTHFVDQVPDADVLVNNLGIFEPKAFLEIEDADWFRFFEVNVLSGVRLARRYLPGMLTKNWGRIIFISSESAQQIPAEMIHYGMTKTAQLAIARGIAESVAGTGVTVNSILPGPTGSEGIGQFVESLAREQGVTRAEAEREFFRTMRPTSLLRRFATPDEVAAVVAFVASAHATTINGAAVRADGGVIRSIV
jgi:NAD(P)-dependent dehydrogenase (short-subunit alcohol dehydrogenase family)